MPPDPDNGNIRPPPQVWDITAEVCDQAQAEVTQSYTSVSKGFSYPEALTLCPDFWAKQQDLPNSGDGLPPKPPAEAHYGARTYKALTLVHELCHFLGSEYDDQPFAPKAAMKTEVQPESGGEFQYWEEESVAHPYSPTIVYSLANEGKLWAHVEYERGDWQPLLESVPGKKGRELVERDPNPMRLPQALMFYAEMSTYCPSSLSRSCGANVD